MIYQLFKIWANFVFRLYFRRLFISGAEHIPKKGAVLILVNHPNSFLEACVIAALQHRNLYFLVRGDMFEKKWLLPILKSTNQIPIYRFKDGFTKLRNNKSTFDQSYEVLSNHHTMLMFPEASSEMVKYLRPLQKGAARLALGVMEEKNLEDLCVVPAGIHYYNAPKSRTDLILKFGNTISIKQWIQVNSSSEDKLTELTYSFQKAMDQTVISIKHHAFQDVYDDVYILAEMDQLPYKDKGVHQTESGYLFLNTLVSSLNTLNEEDLKSIRLKLDELKAIVKNLNSLNAALTYSFSRKIQLLVKLIVYFFCGLPGAVLYGPSLVISKWFAKTKIKHITFYAPVRIAINMILHLLFSVVYFFSFIYIFNFLSALVLLILIQWSLFCFAKFLDLSEYSRYLFNTKIIQNSEKLKMIRTSILQSIKFD
jgi:1-acyl-sn-glycerol-3-phosphate acyltransferase